jgi:hypothetical protein
MTVTLGGKENIKVLHLGLKLETANKVAGTPSRFQQTRARIF